MNEYLKSMVSNETFGEKIEEVKETHISYIFLTKGHAYKIKKDVKFSFLDYSTLDNRELFCKEEFRINKLLSPDMYLKVSAVVKEGNTLVLSESGLPLDYAIVMKRIPEKYIMINLIEKNKIKKETLEEIALKILLFHKMTKVDSNGTYGSLSNVKKNVMDNFKDLECFIGDLFSSDEFNLLIGKNIEFMNKNSSLFDKRVKKGKIIETHGDLHSGNIFVTPEDIYIFDAIEFNPAINTTDVAAEIAFLCMDLEFLGRDDLSKAFSEKYMLESNDKEIQKLLSFYKSYRACVRAKVNGYRASVGSAAKELTKKYFYLALKYAGEL
jgi:aminoglycoside phosphotransferase family enzyme